MTDLLSLAEECEKATGPSAELDARIAEAVNPDDLETMIPWAYTGSIDAALTLVPGGLWWFLSPDTATIRLTDAGDSEETHGNAATTALALCAAALRARAAGHGEG